MSDGGYRTERLPNGHVIQSGVQSGTQADRNWDYAGGFITRAVVLKTYFADDEEWSRRGWASDGKMHVVACDVRTYGRRSRRLYRVPVLQRAHTLHDEDTYIPRDSKVHIGGGQLTTATTPTGQKLTEAENLDGDHVLVSFLEGDPSQPIIMPYMFPHPGSKRRLTEDAGRVKRLRHNGVLVEWDKDGNLSIDATEAAQSGLAQDGSEISNAGTGGNVTIKTKAAGDKLLSLKLTADGKIRLGSDPDSPPTSPLVLGTEWIAVMAQLIDTILAMKVGTGVGPSSTPLNALDFLSIKADIEAKTQVSDFVFTQKAHT